jgi:hypothetical protein
MGKPRITRGWIIIAEFIGKPQLAGASETPATAIMPAAVGSNG